MIEKNCKDVIRKFANRKFRGKRTELYRNFVSYFKQILKFWWLWDSFRRLYTVRNLKQICLIRKVQYMDILGISVFPKHIYFASQKLWTDCKPDPNDDTVFRHNEGTGEICQNLDKFNAPLTPLSEVYECAFGWYSRDKEVPLFHASYCYTRHYSLCQIPMVDSVCKYSSVMLCNMRYAYPKMFVH